MTSYDSVKACEKILGTGTRGHENLCYEPGSAFDLLEKVQSRKAAHFREGCGNLSSRRFSSTMTVRKLAEILRLGRRAIYKLAASNQIPHSEIDSSVHFDATVILVWLEERTMIPTARRPHSFCKSCLGKTVQDRTTEQISLSREPVKRKIGRPPSEQCEINALPR